MVLLTVITALQYEMITHLSSEEEVGVWAWTGDYDLIVTEDDFSFTYGIQNRHTGVIEIMEPIFSNAINYLIDVQRAHDSVSEIINSDGSVNYDEINITPKLKVKAVH